MSEEIMDYNKILDIALLEEVKADALANHIPIIMDDTLDVIKSYLEKDKPKRFLEIGSAVGYSAICFSKYLADGGIIDTIELDEETYNELKTYDKLYAVYFNDNGDEAERIEANLEAEIYNDMPWYYLVFKVSHMSTYGIIGVNDAVAPDTGVITRQGGSATIASAFAAGFVGLLASITSFAYLIKRRKN